MPLQEHVKESYWVQNFFQNENVGHVVHEKIVLIINTFAALYDDGS